MKNVNLGKMIKAKLTQKLAEKKRKAQPHVPHEPDDWKFAVDDLAPFDPLLSSLLILAKLYNRSASAQALTSGLPLIEHKLSPKLFKRAAARIGLSSRIVRTTLCNIEPQQLPVILLLKHSQACVLSSVDAKTATARVVQPESSEGYSQISVQELEKNYIGLSIFIKPTYHFDEDVNRLSGVHDTKNWFWRVMAKIVPYYVHVITASFLINIFALATPLFIMNVYDRVVPTNALPTLWVLAVGIAIIFLFDFLIRNLRAFFIDSVGRGVDGELSKATFEHLMGLEMANVPSSAGVLANSVHNFEFFRQFITSASIGLLVDIPFALLFIVVMAILAGTMALVPILTIPIIILAAFFAQSSLKGLVDEANRYSTEKHKVLIESLSGIETVKCIGAEGVMQKKWETITKNLAKLNAKIRMLANIGVQSSSYINQIALVAVIVFGVYKIAAGDITSGALIACVILLSRILAPITKMAVLFTRYRQAKHALVVLDDVMQMPVEREDEKNFLHRKNLHGSVEFKDVVFNYPDQTVSVFNKASFVIKPGEKVGIIGPSGSGKTTIEKLLLKLYTISSGNILVDGVEIKQLDPAELRHHIGYIPQDVVLFNGTIRDNVAIVAPYVDDIAVLNAIRISGLSAFVATHPDGLDRLIADRGQNLSGGQKQAIAIARALLLNPKILLFDEPCNSMDEKAIAVFISNMKRNLANKTLILSTHHYPLLQLVDRLIVIDSGHVVLEGPKQEVLDKLKEATAKVAAEKQANNVKSKNKNSNDKKH